jgi:hypothetical protein
MKTAQEWLALSESEQAVKLAEVLVEKPWKHEWSYVETIYRHPTDTETSSVYQCDKCQHKESLITAYSLLPMSSSLRRGERLLLLKERQRKSPCPVPDPIDIHDWNVAMEWRDKTVRNIFHECLVDVMDTVAATDVYRYPALMESLLVSFTHPIHYLIAAAMAKEGLKK